MTDNLKEAVERLKGDCDQPFGHYAGDEPDTLALFRIKDVTAVLAALSQQPDQPTAPPAVQGEDTVVSWKAHEARLADLDRLLDACGLGRGARFMSPADVFDMAIAEVERLALNARQSQPSGAACEHAWRASYAAFNDICDKCGSSRLAQPGGDVLLGTRQFWENMVDPQPRQSEPSRRTGGSRVAERIVENFRRTLPELGPEDLRRLGVIDYDQEAELLSRQSQPSGADSHGEEGSGETLAAFREWRDEVLSRHPDEDPQPEGN